MKSQFTSLFLCIFLTSCNQQQEKKTSQPSPPGKSSAETSKKQINYKTRCDIIMKDVNYIESLINVDSIEMNFSSPYQLLKIAHKNFHDPAYIDTIYRMSAANSYIDLEKSFGARQSKDPYSHWALAKIKDRAIKLNNGLAVGLSRVQVAKLLKHPVAVCDTVPFNEEEMTYDNYIIMRNDTVAEIFLSVTAD